MSGNSLSGASPARKVVGYFGKMPVRGDFLSYGLPRRFVDPWDDWIQLALETSRNQFSDSWLEIYLTSPLWQFALAPAVCGDTPWAGVLMPSVDAQGRYYPLTIAASLESSTNITTFLSTSQPWFMKLEELARSCLEDEFDMATFEEEIQSLEHPPGGGSNATSKTDLRGEGRLLNAWRYGLASPAELINGCPVLLQELMDRLFFTYSLWWTSGSARVSPTSLICQGLPPPDGYAAMLDGEWQQWGWEDKHMFDQEPTARSS
jgi:type VI secretion system protein ImpM